MLVRQDREAIRRLPAAAVIAGVIAALIVTAAPAAAATQPFGGRFDDGGSLDLKAKVRHGKPTRINNVRWKHLPLRCKTGGRVTYSGSYGFGVAVTKRHFEARATSSNGRLHSKLVGHFSRNLKRVRGYLRVDGGIPAQGLGRCHSGRVHFELD